MQLQFFTMHRFSSRSASWNKRDVDRIAGDMGLTIHPHPTAPSSMLLIILTYDMDDDSDRAELIAARQLIERTFRTKLPGCKLKFLGLDKFDL